ncbi:MAG: hypothetical protein IKY82_00135 [Alistipes sp.]|nr:hypothetical protein [Alistipes sp.]
MDQKAAIAEVDWYCNLVSRRIERWGSDLSPKGRALLRDNLTEVAENKSSLKCISFREGYYTGQVDEEGLPQGCGIYTRTTNRRDRWTMLAGRWVEGRPKGIHTLYESDCPEQHHYLAAIHFTGNRRKERGMIGLSLSEAGLNTEQRKYRQYEYFSPTTLAVGSAMIFVFLLAITRNSKISLLGVIVVAVLYLISYIRGRQ